MFEEALNRGSSFYLPGLVIPMLPKVLSEDIVSLNPGVDRRALVFEVDLDPTGRVRSTKIHRARVRSRVKTWYDAVQEWWDGRRPCPGDWRVADGLRALSVVGSLRMELAESRDVVQFRRTEMRVHIDEEEARFVARADLRNDVERWNEQISLMCNIEGAKLFLDAPDHVHALFRTHDPPAPERLDALQQQLEGLIAGHDLDTAIWSWRRGEESLARWLARLPDHGPEARIARALHRQALLSTGRAAFTTIPGAHYGVGAAVYGRFTAPMREMVGVFSHKEAWERLGDAPGPAAEDEAIRERILEGAQACRGIQRKLDQEANRLVLDRLFARDLRRSEAPWRTGTVMGISKSKVHVQLDEPPIDVKIYKSHLREQWGSEPVTSRNGTTIRDPRNDGSQIRVGDAVEVQVVDTDGKRDRWRLALQRG